MDALIKEKLYTIDDIEALPDGQRAELVDGRIYDMASPGTEHQRLSMYLSNQIMDYIGRKKGACEVFAAPFAVFLNQDRINYLEPEGTHLRD